MKAVYLDFQELSSLNSKKFQFFANNVFEKHPFVLLVTAEWCGHCRILKPEITKGLKELKATKTPGGKDAVYIVHLSHDTFSHIASHERLVLAKILNGIVSGYPTACVVSGVIKKTNQITSKYLEDRTSKGFVELVEAAHNISPDKSHDKPTAAKRATTKK